VPLYCTSHGKALLADFEEHDLKTLFGGKPLKPWTKNTIVSIRVLAKACEEIRTRGFATDESEFLDGVRCLAAPIRDRDGTVIASIGISAPVARFPHEVEKEYAGDVVSAAARIAEILSARDGE
jgi:DNA-binding IclR family transcriptional regulator